MPLPSPAPRSPLHTRRTRFEGWRRDDGLWDIEAELVDTRSIALGIYRTPPLPAGEPVHDMAIRLTLDDDFVIQAIQTTMDAVPFGQCQNARPPMEKMIGVRVGPGWRKAIDAALGGVRGCTHLRELLFNMATVAYQTIPIGKYQLRQLAGLPQPRLERPPHHVGGCMTWDTEGEAVRQHHPQFVGWQPMSRRTPPAA